MFVKKSISSSFCLEQQYVRKIRTFTIMPEIALQLRKYSWELHVYSYCTAQHALSATKAISNLVPFIQALSFQCNNNNNNRKSYYFDINELIYIR